MTRRCVLSSKNILKIKRSCALIAAFSLTMHDFAWAVCSDGSTLPAGGFVVGAPPIQQASNWSPHVFTGTTGSLWIPDTSVYEHNDPTKPRTGGGHNWVFDQGSTLCKVTDLGSAGALPDSWEIPPNNPSDCIILPVIKNGRVTNLGDIPYQGDVITPTCDPTLLSRSGAPNPQNTYFNQLGCSISHGAATTPATATSFLFVAGIKGGLFSIPLDNVSSPVVGGTAGKTVGPQNYYAQIPEGTLLTNAAVSKDGQFAMVTSIRRDLRVWACLNPLGDPGDPSLPIDPNFIPAPGSAVSCMWIGNNNLAVTLTNAFGPDNQPYFGGRRVVNSFNSVPGGNFTTAWPNCIWQGVGAASLTEAFANNLVNGCGDAQPNFGFTSALITQPPAMITHGKYMYVGPLGGTLIQFAVTQDPFSGMSKYQFRTYVTGLSILTGLGVAEDLKSLMIYTDPTAIGLAAQEIVTKLPLCEDMLGEQTVASTGGGTPPPVSNGFVPPPTTTTTGGTTTGGTTTTATGGTTTGTTTGGTTTTGTTTGTTTTGSTTGTTTATTGTTSTGTTPVTGAIVGGVGTASGSTTSGSTSGAGTGAFPGAGAAGGGLSTAAAGAPAAGSKPAAAAPATTNAGAGTTGITPNTGVPVPTGSTGLFAAGGQDPTGPMTAKVTFISQFGLPRIAQDGGTNPSFFGPGSDAPSPTLARSDRQQTTGTSVRGNGRQKAASVAQHLR